MIKSQSIEGQTSESQTSEIRTNAAVSAMPGRAR
jgi:hypothetical protein